MPHATAEDGTKIHYETTGSGKDVVLVHGWPLSHEMWSAQTEALVDAGFRVTAMCRRGFGHSDKPDHGYDYNTMSEDLAAVMAAAEVKDAALVGFSMGGGEVARYMSRYHEANVSKAVLVSSIVPYMLKTEDNPDGVPAETFADFKSSIADDREAFFKGFAGDFYGQDTEEGGVDQDTLDWTLKTCMMASELATISCIDAFGKTDFRPDLAAFTVPTLVIHGTGDQVVPIDTSGRAAAKGIEGAKLKEYDGAPHGLHATHTEQLNEDLIAFLKR